MENPFELINNRLSNIEQLLAGLSSNLPTKENDTDDRDVSYPNARKFLSVSYPTIKRYMAKGQLPYHTIGSKFFFKESDLKKFKISKGL